MDFLILFLIFSIIILLCVIIYLVNYNTLSIIKIKMDNSLELIQTNLQKKYELMKKLYELIKNNLEEKDYLKDFSEINIESLSIYELDQKLTDSYAIMLNFKEDYSKLNTEEFKNIVNDINELEQIIISSKKYFNKNNNLLIKNLKGTTKLIGKFKNIKVKNSFEIKESIFDSL